MSDGDLPHLGPQLMMKRESSQNTSSLPHADSGNKDDKPMGRYFPSGAPGAAGKPGGFRNFGAAPAPDPMSSDGFMRPRARNRKFVQRDSNGAPDPAASGQQASLSSQSAGPPSQQQQQRASPGGPPGRFRRQTSGDRQSYPSGKPFSGATTAGSGGEDSQTPGVGGLSSESSGGAGGGRWNVAKGGSRSGSGAPAPAAPVPGAAVSLADMYSSPAIAIPSKDSYTRTEFLQLYSQSAHPPPELADQPVLTAECQAPECFDGSISTKDTSDWFVVGRQSFVASGGLHTRKPIKLNRWGTQDGQPVYTRRPLSSAGGSSQRPDSRADLAPWSPVTGASDVGGDILSRRLPRDQNNEKAGESGERPDEETFGWSAGQSSEWRSANRDWNAPVVARSGKPSSSDGKWRSARVQAKIMELEVRDEEDAFAEVDMSEGFLGQTSGGGDGLSVDHAATAAMHNLLALNLGGEEEDDGHGNEEEAFEDPADDPNYHLAMAADQGESMFDLGALGDRALSRPRDLESERFQLHQDLHGFATADQSTGLPAGEDLGPSPRMHHPHEHLGSGNGSIGQPRHLSPRDNASDRAGFVGVGLGGLPHPHAQMHSGPPPPHMEDPFAPPTNQSRSWWYLDPDHKLQGPCAEADMRLWFASGYFTLDLLLHCDPKKRLVPLGDWIVHGHRAFFEQLPDLNLLQRSMLPPPPVVPMFGGQGQGPNPYPHNWGFPEPHLPPQQPLHPDPLSVWESMPPHPQQGGRSSLSGPHAAAPQQQLQSPPPQQGFWQTDPLMPQLGPQLDFETGVALSMPSAHSHQAPQPQRQPQGVTAPIPAVAPAPTSAATKPQVQQQAQSPQAQSQPTAASKSHQSESEQATSVAAPPQHQQDTKAQNVGFVKVKSAKKQKQKRAQQADKHYADDDDDYSSDEEALEPNQASTAAAAPGSKPAVIQTIPAPWAQPRVAVEVAPQKTFAEIQADEARREAEMARLRGIEMEAEAQRNNAKSRKKGPGVWGSVVVSSAPVRTLLDIQEEEARRKQQEAAAQGQVQASPAKAIPVAARMGASMPVVSPPVVHSFRNLQEQERAAAQRAQESAAAAGGYTTVAAAEADSTPSWAGRRPGMAVGARAPAAVAQGRAPGNPVAAAKPQPVVASPPQPKVPQVQPVQQPAPAQQAPVQQQQQQQQQQQKKAEASGTPVNEFGAPTMHPDLERWCRQQMNLLRGNSDITLLEYVLTLESPRLIRETVYQYFGQTPKIEEFVTQFLQQKQFFAGGKVPASADWVKKSRRRGGKKRAGKSDE